MQHATHPDKEPRLVLPAQVGDVEGLEAVEENQEPPGEPEHPWGEEREDEVPRSEEVRVRGVLHGRRVRAVHEPPDRGERGEHLRVEHEGCDLWRLDLPHPPQSGEQGSTYGLQDAWWGRTMPSCSSATAFISIRRGFTSSYPASGGSNSTRTSLLTAAPPFGWYVKFMPCPRRPRISFAPALGKRKHDGPWCRWRRAWRWRPAP